MKCLKFQVPSSKSMRHIVDCKLSNCKLIAQKSQQQGDINTIILRFIKKVDSIPIVRDLFAIGS